MHRQTHTPTPRLRAATKARKQKMLMFSDQKMCAESTMTVARRFLEVGEKRGARRKIDKFSKPQLTPQSPPESDRR
jgi:hypothetical protein